MVDFGDVSTTTPTSLDGQNALFNARKQTGVPEEIYFRSNQMQSAHIMALDQLIQYQCSRLEKQLSALKTKRKLLLEGAAVSVSLNELVSDELLEAAEGLLVPDRCTSVEHRSDESVKSDNSQNDGDEISKIIDSINMRNLSGDGFGRSRRVQFTAHEVSDNSYDQIPRRCATLPDCRSDFPISNDVQLMLHMQGTCKPCAFYYNKKKGCRNGISCGFCHHEDHSSCTLKQWKKQQKLLSQSGSMSFEK
ncbi:hypothetical protein X943_003518 [Babesia divergens]|uniref:C3H1-type domain-containing protein n=1 Tax=Babesia divergens TaxID=32595 RepID=A0AAD9G7S4_BABDI|nr:hypothetical protein X943_003518 [Babesia divergens]